MSTNSTLGKEDVTIQFVVKQEADFSEIPEDEREDCLTDVDFVLYDSYEDLCHLEYKLIHSEMQGDTAIRKIQIFVSLPWNDKESFTEAFQDDFIRDEVDDKPAIDIDCIIAYGFDGFDMFSYADDDTEIDIMWSKQVESASTDSDKIEIVDFY